MSVKIPIYIIDDNEADRYIISRSIEETGLDCTIEEFSNGEDFLSAIDQTSIQNNTDNIPTMILLDINMPGINGFEVLENLEKSSIKNDCFVVLMITSSNNTRDIEKANKHYLIKEFVNKPVDEDIMLKLISKYYP